MSDLEGLDTLIQDYLNGTADEAGIAELQRHVVGNPSAAERLFDAAWIDSSLAQQFRQTRRVVELQSLLKAEPVTTASQGKAVAVRRDSKRTWRGWSWVAIAVVVLVAVGVWCGLYFGSRLLGPDPAMIAQQPHRVISGQVLIGGRNTTELPVGSIIHIADQQAATIRLSDGSQAELDAASVAVLRGRTHQSRQLVELIEGGGMFRVTESEGDFRVKTSVGNVTVVGTKFSVELVSSNAGRITDSSGQNNGLQARHTSKGGEKMRKSILMAVVVLSGVVQVDIAGKTCTLMGGDGQVFAGEQDAKPRLHRSTGALGSIDAGKITIVQRGDRGERSLSFSIGKDTKVFVQTDQDEKVKVRGEGGERTVKRPKVAQGKLSDLKEAQRVTVTHDARGKAVKIFGHRPPRPRKSGEGERRRGPGRVGGVVGTVSANSVTIVQRGDRGERSRSFSIDKDTQVFVQTDQDENVKVRDEEGERTVKRPKLAKVKASDLKKGQRVTVTFDASRKALKILGHRPPKPRKGGEDG